MSVASRSFSRSAWIGRIALVPFLTAVSVFAQTAAAPATPAKPAAVAECPQMAETSIPLRATLKVKVAGALSSAHLKPGKEIWFKAASGVAYPGCTIELDAPVYAHVVSATSTKDSSVAELSLVVDHVDCAGHSKQDVKMRLVGLVAPADQLRKSHNELPTEVAGKGRQIGGAGSGSAAAGDQFDDSLNPKGPQNTLRPGIVLGMPALKLEPIGGPQCSDKITSTAKAVELPIDAQLLLVMSVTK